MNQSQLVVGIAIVALVVVIFVLMFLSWRRRTQGQVSLGTLDAPPDGAADPFAVLEGLHLATTLAGQPLERVTVKPLGFRARGVVAIGADGVEIGLDGSAPAFIPRHAIRQSSRASWTIDRGVEEDGLNVLTWQLGETELDSAFRMRDPQAFDAAIARLLSERTTA